MAGLVVGAVFEYPGPMHCTLILNSNESLVIVTNCSPITAGGYKIASYIGCKEVSMFIKAKTPPTIQKVTTPHVSTDLT